jgi:hypothetical protein|tara:strand:+ start:6082 stop:6321 length:240 start_codon:yes stop_codon:yes gene_type:complete
MCAVKRPNIDQLIKGNKRLKSAFHSKKPLRNTHRVALDELDTFLELVDEAIDAMDDAQEKLNKLYDFCGEVPMDDACDY